MVGTAAGGVPQDERMMARMPRITKTFFVFMGGLFQRMVSIQAAVVE